MQEKLLPLYRYSPNFSQYDLDHLTRLFSDAQVEPTASGVRALFREAFENQAIDKTTIDTTIRALYDEGRKERRIREPQLVSNLYRLNVFDWGGLHQNSLEMTIVDNYVKKITDFDVLSDKVENELHNSMRGYVLCSWYNHWTSIIIEDVFKDHAAILPAVGLVKQIDFFINDVPFDLKVTYLPEGFIKDLRREAGKRPELTLLKQASRSQKIHFDADLPDGILLSDLWAKHRDHPSTESHQLIAELTTFRKDLIRNAQKDPTVLIKWLYENQGVRRFDASNRFFLILVDETNYFESWKLKRAKPLLEKQIHHFLSGLGKTAGRAINFEWEDSKYTVISDVIFVVHKPVSVTTT